MKLIRAVIIFLLATSIFNRAQAMRYTRPHWPGLIKWVDPEYPPELYRRVVTGGGVFLYDER